VAVGEAEPDDLDFRAALLGEVKEIFILADNDAILKFGVAEKGHKKDEERFLTAQADRFAGAKREEKASGRCDRSR